MFRMNRKNIISRWFKHRAISMVIDLGGVRIRRQVLAQWIIKSIASGVQSEISCAQNDMMAVITIFQEGFHHVPLPKYA